MILTKSEIPHIISTGKAEHSPVAQQFIAEAKKQYGVDIVACYLNTFQMMNVEDESVWQYIGFKKHEMIKKASQFTNYFQLTLYYRDFESSSDDFKERYGDDLLRLLKSILPENGCSVEYRRVFSNEELHYYGFFGKKPDKRDNSKIIYPDTPVLCEDSIHAESFDKLALWHITSYAAPVLNRSIIVKSIGAKVYAGWYDEGATSTLYVVLPENGSVGEFTKKMLKREMLMRLHSFDKFGVVKDSDFKPVFAMWSELSENLRFSLSRESNSF